MTRERDAGIFLLSVADYLKLTSEALDKQQIWCKIAEVIIRTSFLPNPTRYMFYKVQYWVNDPALDEFAVDPLSLVLTNNVSEFAVPVGNAAFGVEDYEQYCIRDLLVVSLKRAYSALTFHERNMREAWNGVRMDHTGGLGVRFFTRDTPDVAMEYRSIWHEAIYNQTPGYLSLASEKVIGNTTNGNANIVNVSFFNDGLDWYTYFKNEILSPRTYERQEFFQLPK